jgi:tRNA pseudouridine38-40 synthase
MGIAMRSGESGTVMGVETVAGVETAPAAPPEAASLSGSRRLRLDLAYLGTRFHGFQFQPGVRTVQGELGAMLERLLRREVPIVGAGRTDAGVHARGQVCSLTVGSDAESERLIRHLAHVAPADLQVLAVRVVSPKFNARFSAVSRRYSYHLLLRPDIFRARTAVLVLGRLDRTALDAAAAHLVGAFDFTSFCKQRSLKDAGRRICRIDHCCFEWGESSTILHVRADRFLHNMVRILAGTLVEVGLGRRLPADIPTILQARDRQRAGRTLPAHGLFLEEVIYPEALLDPAYGRGGEPADGPATGEL